MPEVVQENSITHWIYLVFVFCVAVAALVLAALAFNERSPGEEALHAFYELQAVNGLHIGAGSVIKWTSHGQASVAPGSSAVTRLTYHNTAPSVPNVFVSLVLNEDEPDKSSAAIVQDVSDTGAQVVVSPVPTMAYKISWLALA